MQYLRDCQVIIGNANQALSLKDLRIAFEIKKSNVSYPNLAKIQIYNLSFQTRNLIKKEFTNIIVNAGYVGQMQLIFSGNIKNVYHRIDGVDTITEIYAGDGDIAWQDGIANITFGAPMTLREMVIILGTTLPGIDYGALEGLDQPRNSDRPYTFSCATRVALDELGATYNFSWSIQNGLLETWPKNDAITAQSTAFAINAGSGMVGSPTVTEIGANVTTLINPLVLPNRWIYIQAASSNVALGNPYFQVRPNKPTIAQGYYIVNSVTHSFDNRGDDALSVIEARVPGVSTVNDTESIV